MIFKLCLIHKMFNELKCKMQRDYFFCKSSEHQFRFKKQRKNKKKNYKEGCNCA